MKREWIDYLHSNSENEMDCQLVSACNAYYYLTGNRISQNSEEYNELKKKCGCISGSCIDIKKAYDYFNISYEVHPSYDLREILKNDTFIEVKVWHKFFGYHSVCIVDYDDNIDVIRVTNFMHVTSTKGWIFIEDFIPFISSLPCDKNIELKTFKLK